MSTADDHRPCRSRAREAASTTAWVVAILVALLVYEEVSGDTVTRSDRQTIQAWLVGAFALLGIGLGARYALSGQLTSMLRAIRGALPVIVATSLFFSGLTASVFGPPDVVLGALAIGFVLCAALFLTLVLFRWPQRLLVRDLRR